MEKRSCMFIAILVAVILISGCIDIGQKEAKSIHGEEYIEPIEKAIENTIVIEKIDDMELNTHPSFSVGQNFFYKASPHFISDEGYYHEEKTFVISQIETINGREYYAIIGNNTGFLERSSGIENVGSIISTWYCDKENGRCIGKNINPTNYSDENTYATDSSMFAYWMLGLKDNARWSIYVSAKQTEDNRTTEANLKYEFEVIGREKVDNTPSFKVKLDYIDMDTKRIKETRYYWVDADRRILIKKEVFRDNVEASEEKLISEF